MSAHRPLSIFVLSLLVISLSSLVAALPNVPWKNTALFYKLDELSDEFNGDNLDENIWDPHGIRNPDTGCPKWNGPRSAEAPDYSTYFTTTSQPGGGTAPKRYSVSQGRLSMGLGSEDVSYFEAREYYCNTTTFRCNHDSSIECFATNFFGNPIFKAGSTTEYFGVVHAKCKMEPYCIPRPGIAIQGDRIYKQYTGVHLTTKSLFKYGYVEAKVRLPDNPAVLAVWTHDDVLVDGYCRTRRGSGSEFKRVLECPSHIYDRSWQEIDLLEAMNSQLYKQRYVPNVHCFSGYKGVFTSKEAKVNGVGKMGGGPIVVNSEVFNQLKNALFSSVTNPLPNDFHLNVGSVFNLTADWASRDHVVGLYWSANEIRFILDGQEVYRMENLLIHQPMRLDLSFALNVPWAKETPTPQNVGLKATVDYVRTYKVFTANGVEPPSSLPLLKPMTNKFSDRFGNRLKGVYNAFPVNDDITIVPGIPDPPTTTATSIDTNTRQVVNVTDEHIRQAEGPSSPYYMDGNANRRVQVEEDVLNFLAPGENGKVTQKGYKQRGRMSNYERRTAESNPGGISKVEDGKQPDVPKCAQTFTDTTDPSSDGAGWAGRNGEGVDSSSCSDASSR